MKKPFLFNNSFFLLLIYCLMTPSLAEESIRYFGDPDMDFWRKPEKEKNTGDLSNLPSSLDLKSPNYLNTSQSNFPWNKYLDPNNDEFFKEGDYTPPAPFLEIARNPTDDNIENWINYISTKNEIIQRLQNKLNEYSKRKYQEQLTLEDRNPEVKSPSEVIKYESSSIDANVKRFRLRLYFDSKCPHCERMIQTLKALNEKGYWIELRQIDQDLNVRAHIPFPIESAKLQELKQYQIKSVPTLLVGDLKNQTYFKIQGYQTESNILYSIFNHNQNIKKGVHFEN